MSQPSHNVFIITGPTGIGKSAMANRIQSELGCSIVSADSRQVYKEMCIGTAKPSVEEISKYKIETVDHVSIFDEYNAGIFEEEALNVLTKDFDKLGYSIVCGGTGLYLKAITEGFHDFPEIPNEIKVKVGNISKTYGIVGLQQKLKELDPSHFQKIDNQNPRRLTRALSIVLASGKRIEEFTNVSKEKRHFQCHHIVLEMDRSLLYERIDNRVLKMVENGLVNEVKHLHPHRGLKSLESVGYKEIFEYLEGNLSLEMAIEEIQKNSRRYAKRQMTWCRNQIKSKRFHPEDVTGVKEYIHKKLI